MDDSQKFTDAITNLKLTAGYAYTGDFPMTEEKYATVEWVTGVEADGETAITTAVNPHSELTWDKVNAEMARLKIEDDNEKIKKETDKANANQKLKDLGLTDDEIKAIKGIS